MVQIVYKGANEEKKNLILDAAKKRFALMGYSKTSMIEIAKEIGISKATLYYYYPDKVALFTEVLRQEMDQFIFLMEEVRNNTDSLEVGLQSYIDLRAHVFMKLVNVGRASMAEIPGLSQTLPPYLKSFSEREFTIVKDIMLYGVKEGYFTEAVVDDLINLYLDALKGLTIIAMREKYKNSELPKFISELKDQFALLNKLIVGSKLK